MPSQPLHVTHNTITRRKTAAVMYSSRVMGPIFSAARRTAAETSSVLIFACGRTISRKYRPTTKDITGTRGRPYCTHWPNVGVNP